MNRHLLLTLSAIFFICTAIKAETVKLKITYKGAGVANSDITIKHGDASLGSGRTDGDGNVSISAGMLASRAIDVYGNKTCGGTTKSWDVKGWVVLDDNLFFHLKMEDVVKEMAGMGMPESMLISAWGLSASGCNDGGGDTGNKTNSSSGGTTSTGSTGGNTSSSGNSTTDFELIREEKLKLQRDGLENEIALFNNRISKKTVELEDMEDTGAEEVAIRRAQIDLETDKLRRERKILALEDVEAKLSGVDLDRARRGEIRDREAAISLEMERLENEDKELKAVEKEARKEEKFETMGKAELKKNLLDMKANRKSKTLTLKMKGKNMKPDRKAELEKEVEILNATIEKYEKRLDELKGED